MVSLTTTTPSRTRPPCYKSALAATLLVNRRRGQPRPVDYNAQVGVLDDEQRKRLAVREED
jgi:hypothetical protein